MPVLPDTQPPDTVCVYLMTAADYVKIGIAKDPSWRRTMLQSACPFEVRLVEATAFPDEATARRIETSLHRLFADFRGHGEWFGIRIGAIQHALAEMAEGKAVWRCTQFTRSRRRLSPADKLELEAVG